MSNWPFVDALAALDYIPSSVMLPQRRFSTLLQQAIEYQRHQCLYHNLPSAGANFSLYSDHYCASDEFPSITTTILESHKDEVWNIEWSHDGKYLASAGKDKSAIIWRVGVSYLPLGSCRVGIHCLHLVFGKVPGSSSPDWSFHAILDNHPHPVHSVAWSLDDSVLVTSAEQFIKMWNPKVTHLSLCMRRDAEYHANRRACVFEH